MIRSEILTTEFQRELKQQGFPVEDIVSDLATAKTRKQSSVRVLRNWTGLPNNTIKEGIFNEERDVISPKINEAILDAVEPWVTTKTDAGLPNITAKELSRMTRLSTEKVVSVLSRYPLSFSVNGSSFTTAIQKPEFPSDRLTLSESSNYGLSPSRVARAARYQSKKPGGGPVQKAGIQDKDVDSFIRKKAWEEQKIVFTQAESLRQVNNVPEKQTGLEIPQNSKIAQVIQALQQKEFGGKSIVAKDELTKRLTELSAGQPVPVVVFNCLDFDWAPDAGMYPQSIILSDTSTAICSFFRSDLEDIITLLKTVGNPELLIIVPDSELFDDRPFSFAQDIEEREAIGKNVSIALSKELAALNAANSQVIFWSEYCRQQGLCSPFEYTTQNYKRIIEDPKLAKRVRDQVEDSAKYFFKKGLSQDYIDNIKTKMFDRVAWYCAMYAGEGQALVESKAIVINLEDRRVNAWFQRGANGTLPIVTPVDPNGFYKWRNKVK